MKKLLLFLLFVPTLCFSFPASLAWQRIDNETCRFSVPDGWVIKLHSGSSDLDCPGAGYTGWGPMLHIQDPKHIWNPIG